MCEVNVKNFKYLYPEINRRLKEAKFFSIDMEFSALYPLSDQTPSLFDTPSERYQKLKTNLDNVIPLQVGLTAFTFDSEKNSYCGRVYTFYVQPACFQHIHRTFYFQSSTLNFLRLYNFDFNKFVYEGIPYINRDQEQGLRSKIFNHEFSEADMSCKAEFEEIMEREGTIVKSWYEKAKIGDYLAVPKVCTEHHNNEETLFFLHVGFRSRFENLWTFIENGEFIVKKVTKEDYKMLSLKHLLEDDTVDNLLGFSKIFRLLTSLKKPIIGHNLLQDLLLMISSFETSLPDSYSDFKKLIVDLFPVVFDTKTISYEVRGVIPEEKRWDDRGLGTIFDYFKNGLGRHLAPNSPAIEMEDAQDSYGKFHNAGWDSFCAGYVFIRLAHLNIFQKYPSSKRFVSSEHIGGLSQYKNRINIIRGTVPHISLDGSDPISKRPPYLVIESLNNKPVSISQVTSLLGTFAFVEVRRLPFQRTRALIAVDNYGNARRILRDFKSNPDYHIGQYNALKHSPFIKLASVGTLTISSVLILWLTYSVMKR